MKMINMMIGNSKKKVVLANARKGEGILSNICFWGPHVVQISAAEGPHLVPNSLKIRSPLGPNFKKIRSPFHVGAGLTPDHYWHFGPRGG